MTTFWTPTDNKGSGSRPQTSVSATLSLPFQHKGWRAPTFPMSWALWGAEGRWDGTVLCPGTVSHGLQQGAGQFRTHPNAKVIKSLTENTNSCAKIKNQKKGKNLFPWHHSHEKKTQAYYIIEDRRDTLSPAFSFQEARAGGEAAAVGCGHAHGNCSCAPRPVWILNFLTRPPSPLGFSSGLNFTWEQRNGIFITSVWGWKRWNLFLF